MILFKSVSYKNFLAAGNNPIKIDLNSHGTTLIVGQNGAGKSTIIEALVFALFNKSFRKVNKNQLINSINEKDCLVEVEFSIGSVDWKVRRGIKPAVFEIIKNGTVLDQSSSAVDQQKWFEQTVLKLNYKSYTLSQKSAHLVNTFHILTYLYQDLGFKSGDLSVYKVHKKGLNA